MDDSVILLDSPIQSTKYNKVYGDNLKQDYSVAQEVTKTKATKKTAPLKTKRKADPTFSPPKKMKRTPRKTSRSTRKTNILNTSDPDITKIVTETLLTSVSKGNKGNKRGRGGKRGRARGSGIISQVGSTASVYDDIRNYDLSELENNSGMSPEVHIHTRARGRGRSRGGQSRSPRTRARAQHTENYPTYNIGNTAEYPDICINQPLFSKKTEEVIAIDSDNEQENNLNEENKEISVNIFWRNSEYIKLSVRRFQKLKYIFDHFAKLENVEHDYLLFQYNNKILKMDDTPDSIGYSIVKYIEGGVTRQNLSKLIRGSETSTVKDGITLKFQCQSAKKPLDITISRTDKLSIGMIKCAEQMEKSMESLKFYFDGDLMTGKETPENLQMDNGDCIDVKLISQ